MAHTLIPPEIVLRRSDFEFDLPPERIAQAPLLQRDHSRLMIVRAPNISPEHRRFQDIAEYLSAGDVLVLNATRVFPARLRGQKRSGGKAELLLLREESEARWQALVRGVTAAGAEIVFPEGLTACLEERLANGEWKVRFSQKSVRDYLERHGEMPLPPYIKRPSGNAADRESYQTVFAREEGSIAAPTAGFHFTPDLLNSLRAKGVQIVEIVLHVGWGTFRPVRTENVTEHVMLPEAYQMSEEAAGQLNAARKDQRRIVAVGTTAVRTLESICDIEHGSFCAASGQTDLFIYPGYKFKAVDALITNFHLPDSTPLLLACAFYTYKQGSSGEPFSLQAAYQAAIDQKYRFYSYGDAMFIS